MKHISQILRANNLFRSFRVYFCVSSPVHANKQSEQDEFSSANQTSEAKSNLDVSFDIVANIPEAEEQLEREKLFREHVERMRDVSRFSKLTAALKYKKSLPTYGDIEDASYVKNQPKYFRKLYAKVILFN